MRCVRLLLYAYIYTCLCLCLCACVWCALHVSFAERAESALQVKDIEDRLREYEDALDELVIY